MAAWGRVLPDGPIGEAWELADHPRGMSVVAGGPFAGRTLRELVLGGGAALVGDGFSGGEFPLMVKLIDARQRLSVQVHPNAEIARKLGVGQHGKTECWVFLEDGGEIFHGTSPGVDRMGFERALAEHNVAGVLNRFEARKGDVFYLPARTVHALGEGCLLYEVQETSDITFRVYDWDRLGLDGKPRALHVTESMATIDFSRVGFGPHKPEGWRALDGSAGCRSRVLVDGAHFSLHEQTVRGTVDQLAPEVCAVVTCLTGQGTLSTDAGEVAFLPMQTVLVPADAGCWRLSVSGHEAHDKAHDEAHVLVATPKF
jgi:mannose-6-phosphate isomerase